MKKLEEVFTPEELKMIDSGEYRPGRNVLDAKLDLWAAIEREACAKVCESHGPTLANGAMLAEQIRARGVQ